MAFDTVMIVIFSVLRTFAWASIKHWRVVTSSGLIPFILTSNPTWPHSILLMSHLQLFLGVDRFHLLDLHVSLVPRANTGPIFLSSHWHGMHGTFFTLVVTSCLFKFSPEIAQVFLNFFNFCDVLFKSNSLALHLHAILTHKVVFEQVDSFFIFTEQLCKLLEKRVTWLVRNNHWVSQAFLPLGSSQSFLL